MFKLKILLVVGLIMMQLAGRAQEDLQVQGAAPKLYVTHTVIAKETWYSVGRLFNLGPKDIATFNNTVIEKPLVIGQVLKVPLTNTNFSQDGNKTADEVFVPVYHTVQDKEWMYRIGQNYNKVSPETIEKWNNIKNEQLRAGMKLTIGYLKVKPGQSALASKGTSTIIPASPQAPVVAVSTNVDLPATTQAPAKKEEEKKEVVVTSAPPAKSVSSEPVSASASQPVTTPAKEEPKNTAPAENPVNTTPVNNTPVNYKGGYFKSMYSDAGKNTTGNAGIFRSTSGWKDGKYYALMNNVPVGTIIKVTFTSTNKSVYAKVLGQLPDMKESAGLTIRINDAAASELGAENGKFYVDLKY